MSQCGYWGADSMSAGVRVESAVVHCGLVRESWVSRLGRHWVTCPEVSEEGRECTLETEATISRRPRSRT